jgi:hypothetical protein
MINLSLSPLSTSSLAKGNSAEKANAAADKARFEAAIGSGDDLGSPMIGITFKTNAGSASDPAATRPDAVKPHAVLQLGPLVAGHRIGQGEDAGMAATASGAPGLLVAQHKAAERGGAGAALRTVFETGVAERRADLEVPSTLAAGMEAGRDRLMLDMQREAARAGQGASSAQFSSATPVEGGSRAEFELIESVGIPESARI